MFILVSIVLLVGLIDRVLVYVMQMSIGFNARKSVEKTIRLINSSFLFIEVSPRIKYVPTTTTTTTTTTEITTTTVEETTIISSTEPIVLTTKFFEHANEMIINTESTLEMEESNQTNEVYSSSTFASIPSTMIYFDETTLGEKITSTEELVFDDMTTNQANNEEQTNLTTLSTNINEEESLTVSISSNQSRLFHLLANLSQHMTTEHPISEDFVDNTTTATTISLNPCTLENLRANFVYHEYPLDNHKFIFCDNEGKMNIIACSPNYIWSQNEQSCILPN
jgi:hypothetical protein